MSDKDDIYMALMEARQVADWLSRKVQGADARDSVRSSQSQIEQGIAAWGRVSDKIRNGAMHIEPPDDYKHTQCYCSAPTCSPPCSFCTDPENNPDNQLDEFDNPLDGQMGG